MRTTIWLLPLALTACSDVRTGRVLQDLDSSDPAAVERAAIRPWLAHEESVQIEDMLDAALREQYASGLARADDYRAVVRAASIEWVRQVRRIVGDPLHTRVASLQDDVTCLGSVIGDAILLDYVEAAFAPDPRADRVEAALQGLAQQMSCLEQSQSMRLATAMKLAFDDVVMTLQLNQLDGAIPYLAQATANPMLLVHEVERQWGPDAPLSRWFAEYEGALVDGATTRHQPATWHGLWLYDRMTGTMRGFHATEKARDENGVELATFFSTVAQPQLADQQCSFSEMIQRGSYAGRYQCLGAVCAAGDVRACTVPASAGDTAPERGAVDVPGLSTSGALSCVADAAAHSSTREQLTCLVEATGRAALPTDSMAKRQTRVAMHGIKPGGHCELSTVQDEIDFYNMKIRVAESQYQKELKASRDVLSLAIKDLALAQAGKRPTDPMSAEEIKQTAIINNAATEAAKAKATAEQTRAAQIAQFEAALARKKAEAAAAAAGTSGAGSGSSAGSGSGTGSDATGSGSGSDTRCVGGACGGCSAMSAQAQAMLDCVTGMREPTERAPLNSDPIDPASTGTGRECWTDLSLAAGSTLSQSCWAVRCGPSDRGANACCGGASTTGEPMQMDGMCGSTDCGDGVQPTYSGGRCTCGGTGAGLPGGPKLPSGPNMPNRPAY